VATRQARQQWFSNLRPDRDSVVAKFFILLAAIAFTAAPFGVMTVLAPAAGLIDSEGQITSIWADLILLVVGPACAIWVLVGLWWSAVSALALLGVLAIAVWRHPVVIILPILVIGVVLSGVSLPSVALPHFGSHSESITDRAARGVEPCHFSGPEWLWQTRPEEILVCTADPTRRVVMAFYSTSTGAGLPLEREAGSVHASRTGTCPHSARSIHAYYYSNEQRAGSVLCYRRNGHVIYAWSNLEARRFTKVYFWHIRSFKVAQHRWEQLAF
jgi:hypothetical protein